MELHKIYYRMFRGRLKCRERGKHGIREAQVWENGGDGKRRQLQLSRQLASMLLWLSLVTSCCSLSHLLLKFFSKLLLSTFQ